MAGSTFFSKGCIKTPAMAGTESVCVTIPLDAQQGFQSASAEEVIEPVAHGDGFKFAA